MLNETHKTIWADAELIEAIKSFPLAKTIEHCGSAFSVNPFEINASCPTCGAEIKLRAFSALYEIEDVFDAVFLWLRQPGALAVAQRRQQQLVEQETNDSRAS